MYLLIKNKNYSNSQYFLIQGFTLIEVMITLVILAVLSSLAIPWYGDYTRKTRVAESINLAATARSQTVELIAIGQIQSEGLPVQRRWKSLDGSIPVDETNNQEVFVESPNSYIDKIARVGSLVIISYTTKMDAKGINKYSLVYYASFADENGSVRWTCLVGELADQYLSSAEMYIADLGTSLPTRWAPKNCVSSLDG